MQLSGQGSKCRHRQWSSTLRVHHIRAVSTLQREAPLQEAQQASVIHIYHRTGWGKDVMHGSLKGGPWKDLCTLEKVPGSGAGKWRHGRLELGSDAGSSEGKLLEFVLTDKEHHWDKAADGGNFVVTVPGVYQVQSGRLQPVSGKRVMVVSDLDGTMVGDDNATKQFKQWWEEAAVPRGGVLVYNTGRALDSFTQLLRDKAHCLAHPDALISAVGTKVYEYDGAKWVEDMSWSSTLDEEWHLDHVREAAYKALAQVGKDKMHFRPPEEQNNHKVTCGVQTGVLPGVLDTLQQALEAKRVRANIITSGHGEWRFLDVVPIRAGKLAALNFVRQRYGFGMQEAVACGDSGNDILMLEGENPAIVVGNAQADLRNWYQARVAQEAEGTGPDGKPRLLMTKAHEALGILEGLATWGFK